MATATFLATRNRLQADYPLWSQVSAEWHESLVISGALMVAVSAALGSVIDVRQGVLTLPLRQRSGSRALFTQACATGGCAVLGHALGLLPLELQAWREATAGSLQPADVVIGAIGLFSLAVLGFCLGSWAGSVLMAPLAGLLVFGLLASTQVPAARPLGLLVPVRGFVAGPRFTTVGLTAAYACLSAAALVMCVVALTSLARARLSVSSGLGTTGVWAATTVGLILVAFAWRPEIYAVNRPVPVTCRTTHEVRVCVHTANARALPTVINATEDMRHAGLGALLGQVTDEAAAPRDRPEPDEALIMLDPGPRERNYFTPDLRSDVLNQIAERFITAGCVGREGLSLTARDTLTAVANRVLALTDYQGETNSPTLDNRTQRRINTLTPAQVRELLTTRKDALSNCALSAKDLP